MPDKSILLRRKNFTTAALITVILWIAWIVTFFFVPPEYFLMPIGFIALSFLCIFFTGSLLLASTRRGILTATGIVLFMILRYFDIGNYLNLVLLAGIFLSIEYYLSQKIYKQG